jgi:hypothetical protein
MVKRSRLLPFFKCNVQILLTQPYMIRSFDSIIDSIHQKKQPTLRCCRLYTGSDLNICKNSQLEHHNTRSRRLYPSTMREVLKNNTEDSLLHRTPIIVKSWKHREIITVRGQSYVSRLAVPYTTFRAVPLLASNSRRIS